MYKRQVYGRTGSGCLIITVGAGRAATELTVPEGGGGGPPIPGSRDTGGKEGGGALAVMTTDGTAVALTNGGALVKGAPRLT